MISTGADTTQTNNKSVYDLYAVSNHYGTMNGGHYTAMCQNAITKSWYEFDDSQVNKLGSNISEISPTVCGKAAYVLFYRKRK
jgi:ubiquitin C-terminal hydrolase